MRIPFRHGETILHIAARRNWMVLCQWLLCLGVDVNRTDILGRTALHHAAQHNAVDAANFLVERGTDLDAKDWQQRTALELAETGRSEAISNLIREKRSLAHAQYVKGLKVQRSRK
ncbi:MAG: hypothetical protein CMN55_00980 [Sneathiella sp.]|uniref:ankyrin repeat domain-containing protein n=1 Tax=Sneathiella sp. TaxID=1964365 RepID=UPI000C676423|nr:hypothetical protein [Sneathiella sp.]